MSPLKGSSATLESMPYQFLLCPCTSLSSIYMFLYYWCGGHFPYRVSRPQGNIPGAHVSTPEHWCGGHFPYRASRPPGNIPGVHASTPEHWCGGHLKSALVLQLISTWLPSFLFVCDQIPPSGLHSLPVFLHTTAISLISYSLASSIGKQQAL